MNAYATHRVSFGQYTRSADVGNIKYLNQGKKKVMGNLIQSEASAHY